VRGTVPTSTHDGDLLAGPGGHRAVRGAGRIAGPPPRSRGYLPIVPLLATVVLPLPVIALSTALQTAAGITFTAGEVVGPVTGFAVLGTLATWSLVRLLRAVPTTAPEVPDVHVRA
jgi:hypothetical protein